MSRREMPNWPTYMQGITVVFWMIVGTVVLWHYAELSIAWALVMSTVFGFLAGLVAQHFWEWVYNAHANSVEGKVRYNFGIFVATSIAAVATVVGVTFQLYKG